jgi:ABC-type branched-subunit amino acid transport system permease subunit
LRAAWASDHKGEIVCVSAAITGFAGVCRAQALLLSPEMFTCGTDQFIIVILIGGTLNLHGAAGAIFPGGVDPFLTYEEHAPA